MTRKVTLRDGESGTNPSRESSVRAEKRRLPFARRGGRRHMWQWTLAAAPRERKKGPGGLRAGVCGCGGGKPPRDEN